MGVVFGFQIAIAAGLFCSMVLAWPNAFDDGSSAAVSALRDHRRTYGRLCCCLGGPQTTS